MAKTRFLTGVGRLVQGSVDEPQTTDAQGAPRVVKTGPNAGQPNPQFFIGVAFSKNETPDPITERKPFDDLWGLLVTQAATDFPTLFPNAVRGDYTCVHPNFAYKVIDGDSIVPNQSGRLWSTYEGFAGHWVVRFASAYPPRCFYTGRYAPQEQIQEKGAIKRGYYVRVSGTVEGNANAQRPGLYVNLDMVELAAYGPEITSGPDAAETFGAGPVALPAGASATPLTPASTGPAPAAPGTPPIPPMQPAPAAPVAAPSPAVALPAPVSAGPQRPTDPTHIHAAGTADEMWWLNGAWAKAPAAPVAPPSPPPVQPYTGYMAPPAAPAAPGTPPVPPMQPAPAAPAASPALPAPGPASSAIASPGNAPPARAMLPAAKGASYEQMIAAGWTDDTLRAHGMMA